MKFIKTDSYEKLSRQAANLISAQIILYPDSVIGLATGSTPLGTYRQLVAWYEKGDLDFSSVKTVNLDEYVGLAPDDEHSYRYFMDKNLFSKINIKRENTYLPDGLSDPAEVAREYDKIIEGLGGIDLQLLGIGHNGHIGFNEPDFAFEKTTHAVELDDSTINANARFFADRSLVPRRAVTMGMKSIMQAKKIVLIASGEDKREILHKALYGPVTPAVPASILQLHPCLTVITDA